MIGIQETHDESVPKMFLLCVALPSTVKLQPEVGDFLGTHDVCGMCASSCFEK